MKLSSSLFTKIRSIIERILLSHAYQLIPVHGSVFLTLYGYIVVNYSNVSLKRINVLALNMFHQANDPNRTYGPDCSSVRVGVPQIEALAGRRLGMCDVVLYADAPRRTPK